MAVKVEMGSPQREMPQQVKLPPISMLVPATYVQEQLCLPPLAAQQQQQQEQEQEQRQQQQQQQQQRQNVKDGLNPVIRLRKQCPVCGKICSRPSTLKTHFLIHTGDTPFKCTWQNCHKSFNVKSNMLRHLKSHERRLAKQASQTNQRF